MLMDLVDRQGLEPCFPDLKSDVFPVTLAAHQRGDDRLSFCRRPTTA